MTMSRREKIWWGATAILLIGLAVLIRPAQKKNEKVVSTACIPRNLEQNISSADLILSSNIFAIVPSGTIAEVILSPQRLYKGILPATSIRVAARPVKKDSALAGQSDPSDLSFKTSQPPYLLFLRHRPDGRYLTSKCWGSRLLGNGLTADEKIQLGEGQLVDGQP